MKSNQMQCLPLGGIRCITIAQVQAAKPDELERHPVISFGGMRQICSLGDNRMVMVGRIGGIAPKKHDKTKGVL